MSKRPKFVTPVTQDGIYFDNSMLKKSEPLITVEQLRARYMFGIHIIDPVTGEELPREVYQDYINSAVSWLEHHLDISMTPVNKFVEMKDYRYSDYVNWGFMRLNNIPVRRMRSLTLSYFKDGLGQPAAALEIPKNWMRISAHDGMIRLLPNLKFPANLQVNRFGLLFPEVFSYQMIPHVWEVIYDHGFDSGRIPPLINQAIGYLAALQAYLVGGNLVIGAGIAESHIEVDDIKETIKTTQSAENSAFSAPMKEISKKLFGTTHDSKHGIIAILRRTWHGGDGMEIL